MSITTYLSTSFSPRHFQPLVRFRTSFARPRLESTGSVADSKLPNRSKQGFVVRCFKAGQPGRDPFSPYLHGMFEAQLTRVHASLQGRLDHQQTDQVVCQQIDPKLFLAHLRSLTTQDLQAQRGLDVAEIQLHVPPALVQSTEFSFAHLAVREHGCNQYPRTHFHLAHAQLRRECGVLSLTHPKRSCLGLTPGNEVITRTKALTAAKIGSPRTVLLKQHVNTQRLQSGDEKIVAIKRIRQHHIPGAEDLLE